jgi:hypothetical protein
MEQEGMVHALEQIRLLRRPGTLIEIHPALEVPFVEVWSNGELSFREDDPGFDYEDDLRLRRKRSRRSSNGASSSSKSAVASSCGPTPPRWGSSGITGPWWRPTILRRCGRRWSDGRTRCSPGA